MHLRTKWGFTLIELLVTIGLVAILSAGVTSLIGPGSGRYARDSRRKADIEQIRSALELYRNSNSGYPTTAQTLSVLAPRYIMIVPTDPKNAAYSYVGTATTYTVCTTMEIPNDANGVSCPATTTNYGVSQP